MCRQASRVERSLDRLHSCPCHWVHPLGHAPDVGLATSTSTCRRKTYGHCSLQESFAYNQLALIRRPSTTDQQNCSRGLRLWCAWLDQQSAGLWRGAMGGRRGATGEDGERRGATGNDGPRREATGSDGGTTGSDGRGRGATGTGSDGERRGATGRGERRAGNQPKTNPKPTLNQPYPKPPLKPCRHPKPTLNQP